MIRDEDMVSTMLFELNNMRPTVRAETGISIFKSGNEVAVRTLREEIDTYFGDNPEVEVQSEDDLGKYLEKAREAYKADPDLADSDESFYGGDDATDDDGGAE